MKFRIITFPELAKSGPKFETYRAMDQEALKKEAYPRT